MKPDWCVAENISWALRMKKKKNSKSITKTSKFFRLTNLHWTIWLFMSLEDPEYCRQPEENKLHCWDCINEKNGSKKREEKQNIEYLSFFKF